MTAAPAPGPPGAPARQLIPVAEAEEKEEEEDDRLKTQQPPLQESGITSLLLILGASLAFIVLCSTVLFFVVIGQVDSSKNITVETSSTLAPPTSTDANATTESTGVQTPAVPTVQGTGTDDDTEEPVTPAPGSETY